MAAQGKPQPRAALLHSRRTEVSPTFPQTLLRHSHRVMKVRRTRPLSRMSPRLIPPAKSPPIPNPIAGILQADSHSPYGRAIPFLASRASSSVLEPLHESARSDSASFG